MTGRSNESISGWMSFSSSMRSLAAAVILAGLAGSVAIASPSIAAIDADSGAGVGLGCGGLELTEVQSGDNRGLSREPRGNGLPQGDSAPGAADRGKGGFGSREPGAPDHAEEPFRAPPPMGGCPYQDGPLELIV